MGSFPECVTREFHKYLGDKVQALKIYNSNDKSIVPNIKPTALVIDLSPIAYAKAVSAAAKSFEKFLLELLCNIQGTYIDQLFPNRFYNRYLR